MALPESLVEIAAAEAPPDSNGFRAERLRVPNQAPKSNPLQLQGPPPAPDPSNGNSFPGIPFQRFSRVRIALSRRGSETAPAL
ncbi:hypothetical protein D3C87_2022890 [compost metagenome]